MNAPLKIDIILTAFGCEQLHISIDCDSAVVLIQLKFNLKENIETSENNDGGYKREHPNIA